MHGRSDDPAQTQGYRSRQNGGGHVVLVDDFLPQIERRKPGQDGEGDGKYQNAEAGEEERVEDGKFGHGVRVFFSL